MKKLFLSVAIFTFIFTSTSLFAMPTVFPTGTTIYNPKKCYNGYTILNGLRSSPYGQPLIDMNGNVVHKWMGVAGFPAKVLPGGKLLAQRHYYDPEKWQDQHAKDPRKDVVLLDWDGNILWELNLNTQRHELQIEGNPVGYYVPGMDFVEKGKKLIIEGHRLFEIDWDKNILWEWNRTDHNEELTGASIEFNTASWLGPNKWYDSGDERFHPDNIILDDQDGSVIYIISHKTGKITWKIGPDYTEIPQLKKLGLGMPGAGGIFVGGMLHHAHMIPKGLPGEGNILVFNNGMPFSIVTEFNPVTLDVVWEYSGAALGYNEVHAMAHSFFSPTASSAQRLPNGNTLICEANGGRVFEVTEELETVWEYINPNQWYAFGDTKVNNNLYRAYRIPYDYIPQLPQPDQRTVVPPDNAYFNIEPIEGPGGRLLHRY
jgi:hypothetical protein